MKPLFKPKPTKTSVILNSTQILSLVFDFAEQLIMKIKIADETFN